jgi:hypothetical protein
MSEDDGMSEGDTEPVSMEMTSSRRVTFTTNSDVGDDEYEDVSVICGVNRSTLGICGVK